MAAKGPALHPREVKGLWAQGGNRPSLGGGAESKKMCEGRARKKYGHVTEPRADEQEGQMYRETGHVKGILSWRVGAAELARSEVSGMSG